MNYSKALFFFVLVAIAFVSVVQALRGEDEPDCDGVYKTVNMIPVTKTFKNMGKTCKKTCGEDKLKVSTLVPPDYSYLPGLVLKSAGEVVCCCVPKEEGHTLIKQILNKIGH